MSVDAALAGAETAPAGGACSACLRRGALLGRMAPRLAGLLGVRGRRRSEILGLSDEQLIAALGGPGQDRIRRWLGALDGAALRAQIEAAGLSALCRHSPGYPPGLLALTDPPTTLYLRGGRERFERMVREAVTVIGGRKATPYAIDVAERLGRELAVCGVTVVSGLALGVDGAAHRGSAELEERSLAVLASGADRPYPRRHADLYERVAATGCVVSELPPGTAAFTWAFPARNRIMAALGAIVVVVEATEQSGSLITAEFAEDLGREVCAVPGQVTLRQARGSNGLLRDGAQVVRGASDVLDQLFGVGCGRRPPESPSTARLDPPARQVLEAVEAGEHGDGIGYATGLSPASVRAALGRLEMLGAIRRDEFGAYRPTGG